MDEIHSFGLIDFGITLSYEKGTNKTLIEHGTLLERKSTGQNLYGWIRYPKTGRVLYIMLRCWSDAGK